MHIETERKFLVLDDGFKAAAVRSCRIRQGYIAHDGGNTVRIRIRDRQGILTIKGPSDASGLSRKEWEKEIPLPEAEELFLLCRGGVVDKTRYIVPAEGTDRYFEVDEFHGANEGLVVAEIELSSEDEPFDRPAWLGQEVSDDPRYYNSHLLIHPYNTWK